MYRRREKRGREAGYPRGRELGEIGNTDFTTMPNISHWEKHTEAGTTKEGGGNREYKVREAVVQTPCPPTV